METIAVYWEATIKTYGFFVKTDLSLVKFSVPCDRMGDIGEWLQTWKPGTGGFIMASGMLSGDNSFQLSMLFEGKTDPDSMKTLMENDFLPVPEIDHPVELITFQGPHYGDRYGIADAAFTPFAENNLAVLASACTGAGIYIVVPQNRAKDAVGLLSKKFVVPGAQG